MSALEVNQPQTVTIKASEYWNYTNIYLEATVTYSLEVQGQQFWHDAWIRSDADGYTKQWLHWAEFLRRSPNDRWFALIGNINQSAMYTFLIGKRTKYKPTVSGELLCYANDVPFMYWNNQGQLLLTVTRLS
jgi:hypothetical protein